DVTAKEALFEAGKLYRVITDRFWVKGGDYVVPDLWANQALDGLHNQIMAGLIFDSNVLLKYIDSKIERQEFLDKLKLAEKGVEHYADLREQYVRYKDWVLKQDKELKCLAANARAYSDLFGLEMKRLYKDVWGKTADDPLKTPENAAAHNNLGNAHTSNRDYENAAEAYTKAAKLDATNPIFLHNHGKMLSRRGQYEAAAAKLDEAIKLGMAADRVN